MITKILQNTLIASVTLFISMTAPSCSTAPENFNEQELSLIHVADSIMRVLVVDNPDDSAVLRAKSSDLSVEV